MDRTMKILVTFSLILFIGTTAFAQNDDYSEAGEKEFKTVFQRGNDKVFISGFGGPQMAFTSIGDHFAHMMGGGGGVLINNFFFGGYGVGLTTPIPYKYSSSDSDNQNNYESNLEFGHGGLWAGFIIARKKPIHLSVSSQFGWGTIASKLNTEYDLEPVSSENIFVFTPIAEVEMNFSHFFKVGIGASASFLQGDGIVYTPYSVNDFVKPSLYLTFKFGWFN